VFKHAITYRFVGGADGDTPEKETDWQNIIITGDMDTLQLISDRTSVYTMSRGLSDSVLYGAEEVKARYGLRPDQIVDYKALRGDASDNIPGVKGIGEKGATELLQAFATLDGVYQAAEQNNEKIKARTRELLLQDKDNAYLSQRLATINREVPIKIQWDDFKLDSFDENEAEAVFQKMEFRSLLSKLKQIKNLGTAGTEKAEDKRQTEYQDKFARNQTEKKYQLIRDDNSFNAFFKKLQKQSAFAIDTETEGLDPLKARLLGLSFSWQAGEAYYLHLGAKTAAKSDLFNYRQEEAGHDWLKRLQTILEDRKIQKYGHNLKFDWRILKNQGINLQGIAFDSLLASYLLNP
jgi:DNA polymerase-1